MKSVKTRWQAKKPSYFRRLQIQPLERRDLLSVSDPAVVAVTSGAAPNSAVVGNGQTISVTYTVQNQGTNSPQQTWNDAFYLSSKNTLDSSAVFLSVAASPSQLPLPPGGTYTTAAVLGLTNTSLTGSNFLLIVPDQQDSVTDSQSASNTYALPINLSTPNVNLKVSNPTISKSSLIAGADDSATVGWTVTNQGTETAKTNWNDNVYLSSSNTVDSSSVLLGKFFNPQELSSGDSYTQSQVVKIPNLALTGSLQLLVVADGDNTQSETNESDNTAALPVMVSTPSPAPNLKVTSVTSPSSNAAVGSQVTLSWTVQNSGAGPTTTSWNDIVYASPTATFDPATAVPIESLPGLSLAAGGSYQQSQSIYIPTTALGKSFLIVVANGDNAQPETSRSDNAKSLAMSIVAPSLAIVNGSFQAPATGDLGDAINLSWSVQNTSALPAHGPWFDSIYLSNKSTFDSSAQLVQFFLAPLPSGLAAGSTYQQSVQLTLPDTAVGSRFLLLVADDQSISTGQGVSNSGPVVAAKAITLFAPDLVASLTAPASVTLGSPINISWMVKNQGSVPANGAWLDSIYVSNSPTFDFGSAQLLTTVPALSTLAAGASYTQHATINLPSIAAAGAHLFVVADSQDQQGQLHESVDNIASQAITVVGPDLTVQWSSPPTSVVAGNRTVVTWTVTNSSSVDAIGTWLDQVYLSTTPTLNTTDASTYWSLGSFSAPLHGPLKGGGSYTTNQTVTMPNLPAGTYYLVVNANSQVFSPTDQAESNTANDFASASVALSVPNVLLVATSASPSLITANAGDSGVLTYTIQNQGSAATNSAGWEDSIYFSTTPTYDSTASLIGQNFYSASSFGAVAAGAKYTNTSNYTLPNVPAGSYYLLVVPNSAPSNQSEPSTPAALAVPITITIPDVRLSTAITDSPSSVQAGTQTSISYQVTNNGTQSTNASSWSDTVYLSQSPTLDSTAYAVAGAFVYQLPLGPGANYTQSPTLFLPSVAPGNYYLIVKADVSDQQAASDSSHRVASVPITVTAATTTTTTETNVDLVIPSATAPASAAAGASVPISLTVKNQGTDSSAADSYVSVYLSNNTTFNNSTLLANFSLGTVLAAGQQTLLSETLSIPSSNIVGGNRYLVFVAQNGYSGGNNVSTYNNMFAVPISVTTPDLTVTTASAPATAVEGSPVNVSWTVKNQGATTASGAWNDSIYLSASPVLGAGSQILLGTFSEPSGLSSLVAGASYTDSRNVTLPNYTTGMPYLLIETDHFQSQADPDRTNNVFAVPITLTAPDLTVSNVSVLPTQAEEGNAQAVALSWNVTNSSSVNAAGFWFDAVYLSTSPTFSFATATQISTVSNPNPLSAGATYTQHVNVAIPATTTGQQYLFVVANIAGVQSGSGLPESDTTNNMGSTPITLTAPNVNLQVATVTPTASSYVPYQPLQVNFKVNNIGGENAATTWSDQIYISASSTFDSGAASLGTLSHFGGVAGGSNYNGTFNVTIPNRIGLSVVTAGTYYLYVVTNSTHVQGESSTADNVSAAATITIDRSTLSVSVPNPPTTVAASDDLTVAWQVTNSSSLPAYGGWTDGVYLSTKPTYDSNATYLTSDFQNFFNSPLAAGASYSENSEFTIPGTASGSMYLLFVADPDSGVFLESALGARTVAVPIFIGSPTVDLQVTPGSVNIPATVSTGSPATVSWSVENTGNDAAAGDWNDAVFLSTSNTFDSSAQFVDQFNAPSAAVPLGPSASYLQSQQIDLSAYAPGNYYLYVETNLGGLQSESNTSNDVSAAIPVTIAAPSLSVVSVTSTNTLTYTQPFQISWTGENDGAGAVSGNWFDSVYLSSTPGTLSPNAEFLNSFLETHDLAAGGGQYNDTQTITLDSFNGQILGQGYLVVVPNSTGGLGDIVPSNANGSAAVTVTSADLVVTNVGAPVAAVAGSQVTITWTVMNEGTATTHDLWFDQLFISPDNQIDSTAVSLGSFQTPTAPLAPGASYLQTETITLPDTFTGTEHILVRADAFNTTQSGVTNNVNSTSIDLSAADLTVGSVTGVPVSAQFGQTLTVGWTVTNQGSGPADAIWNDRIYISPSPIYSGSATLLATVPVGNNTPLAAGASYTQSKQVTLPLGSLVAGNYYILVLADADGGQLETNTGNDQVASSAVSLSYGSLPKLIVASVTTPTSGLTNQQVVVSWTDQNAGSATAVGPWTDKVYLATDAQGDNPALVGSFSFPGALAGGDSSQLSQQITLPTAPGNYWLVVTTNADGAVNEGANAGGNTTTASSAITVATAPLPDLVVTGITPPQNGVQSGSTVPISFTIKNQGNAPTSAPTWQDWVILSTDPNLFASYGDSANPNDGGSDQTLNNQPVILGFNNPSYLDAGQSYTQTVNVALPISAQGTWYVYVVPDGTGFHHPSSMPEASRTDKLAISSAFSITLSPPPNLAVTNVQSPAQAFSGQPLAVNWTVGNSGPGPTVAEKWIDSIYLSSTPTITGSSVLLDTVTHDGDLTVGGSYTGYDDVTLPAGISGAYYLLVRTDALGAVFQNGFNSDDVAASSAVNVNLTPPSDLQTNTVISTATSLSAGHQVSFSYQVINAGASKTPATNWTDSYYLSPTVTYNPATAVLLGSQTHQGALASDESYTSGLLTETIPNGTSGTYYLLVQADSAAANFELNTTNNVGASAALTIASQPAKLAISATAPATGSAGGTILVNWTVQNQGTGDTVATSWQDVVYAEKGPTFDGNAVLLGSFVHTGLLNAGGSYSQAQSVTLPPQLSGTYNLFVVTNRSLLAKGPSPVYEISGNDTSAAIPIQIAQNLPDLKVTSVTDTGNAATGSIVTVDWKVQNTGAGKTSANSWADDVWVSTQPTLNSGGTDIYLGTYVHANSLAAGANYTASLSLTLPSQVASGPHYFIVATDRPFAVPGADPANQNLVLESDEQNNTLASTVVSVTQNAPQLAVSNIAVTTPAYAGQQLPISWTVTNNGAATGNVTILDSVYLSYDQVLGAGDRYLGSVGSTGGLAAGGSYRQSASFTIPAGLTGTFYVFVVTNSDDKIYEADASAGTAFAAQSINVQLAPPANLVAGTLTIPPTAVPGSNVTITYQVSNAGPNAASGAWVDSLYLSASPIFDASDALLGQVSQIRTVAPGGNYTGTLTAPLPGLAPGTYYVLLRTNIRNNLPETTQDDNFSASLTQTSISVPSLTLGQSTAGTLVQGQSTYYEVTVPAGQTLNLSVTGTVGNTAELYASFGTVPTRSQYDQRDAGGLVSPQLTVATTQAGTYYVLLYGSNVPGSDPYSITPQLVPFSVTAVVPSAIDNNATSTIEIDGARFLPGTTFSLIAPGGAVIPSSSVLIENASTAYATFALSGAAVGSYAVRATLPDSSTTTLSSAMVVQAGTGGTLKNTLTGPASVLPGEIATATQVIVNNGDADVGAAPLVVFGSATGTFLALTPDGVQYDHPPIYLAVSPTGPAGTLRPGEQVSRSISFQGSTTLDAINEVDMSVVGTDSTVPLDWNAVSSTWIASSWAQSPNWNAALALLRQHAGSTLGSFVQMLDKAATLLPEGPGDPSYLPDLLNVEITHDLASVNGSISGSVQPLDLSIPIANVPVSATNLTTGDILTATTYTDGSFVFLNATPGQYTFQFDGAIVAETTPVNVGAGQPVTGVVVPLSRGSAVSGAITAAGSSIGISGASVELFGGSGGLFSATTDSFGHYEVDGLPADTYSVIVKAAGRAEGYIDSLNVGTTDLTQNVSLDTEGIVAGTIVLPSGSPPAPQFTISAAATGSTNILQTISTTDPSGAFSLGGLPTGSYTITISAAAFAEKTLSGVSITSGQTTSLGNIAMALGASIAGTITSNDSRLAAAGAAVGLYQGTTFIVEATADGSGHFSFENLPAGSYTVQPVTDLGIWTPVPVTVAAGGSATGVLLSVHDGAVITGQALNASSNQPLIGVPVNLGLPNGTIEATTTDSQGNYQFTGLAVGSYKVSLEIAEDQAFQTVNVLNVDSTYSTNLSSVFPASIGGKLLDAQGNPIYNGEINLVLEGSVVASTASASDGSFSFLLKQAGTYELDASFSGSTFAPITGLVVGATQNVVQDLHAGDNSLQVKVSGSGAASDTNTVSLQIAVNGIFTGVGTQTVTGNGMVDFTGLIPGQYRVFVAGQQNLGSTTNVNVVEGNTASASAALAPLGSVAGHVTNSSSTALASADLILTSPADGSFQRLGISLSDGSYSIGYVPAGTYDLTVVLNGYAASVSSVTVTGTSAATMNVALATSITTVTGTVSDANGNPILGATVTVIDALGHEIAEAAADSSGAFSLSTVAGAGLTVQISASGYSPQVLNGVNVAAGTVVNLGAIHPVAVADPPPDLGGWNNVVLDVQEGIAMVTNEWYSTVLVELAQAQETIDTRPGPPPAPPTCPQCNAAYNAMISAYNKQEQLAEELKPAISNTETLLKAYGSAWSTDGANALSLVLSTFTNIPKSFVALSSQAGNFANIVQLLPLVSTMVSTINSFTSTYDTLSSVNSYSDQKDKVSASVTLGTTVVSTLINTVNAALNIMLLDNQGIDAQRLANGTYKFISPGGNNSLLGMNLLNNLSTGLGVINIAQNFLTNSWFKASNDAGAMVDKGETLVTALDQNLKITIQQYNKATNNYEQCEATATCNQKPGGSGGPFGPFQPIIPIVPPTYHPRDPNDIIGPAGTGAANFVSASSLLPYQIDFENEPTAGLPAQQVTVSDQLDSNLNWQSFRLGSFGFGGQTYTVPANMSFYQTRLDLTQTMGFDVDVTGTIDERTGVATWTFTTIDPATGEIPLDSSIGFLPPDVNGSGEGFVSYSVSAQPTLATGTVIHAQATITFYTQPPIDTPQIFNTIDTGAGLSSAVTALAATRTNPTFAVSWSGVGAAGSSAIDGYTIYVSDDGGPFSPWLVNTTATSATFVGRFGHTYAFYSRATDNAGNVEAAPLQADTSTTVSANTALVPGVPSLLPASDAGTSGSDHVTNLNTPTFTGTGKAGNTVEIFAGSQLIGQATVSGAGTYTVPIAGALNDGTYTISADQVNGSGQHSDFSPAMLPKLVIDTVAPTVAVDPASPTSPPAQYTFTFSEPVYGFSLSDLKFSLDGGVNLLAAAQTLTTSDQIHWTLANLTALESNPGSYQLTLNPAGITDAAGNALAAGAQSAFSIAVPQTSVSLTSNANPATAGQSVTLTATVSAAPGTGTPTGTVTFMDGNVVLGTGTLNVLGGVDQATISISSLAIGNHFITAAYASDGHFSGSASSTLLQAVQSSTSTSATTTTALSSSSSTAVAGQSITLTAIVAPSVSAGAAPAGTVTFYDGTTAIGTASLGIVAGVDQATLSISTLSIGGHTLSAVYTPSGAYTGSVSNTLSQTINQAATSLSLASSGSPTVWGQSLTLMATIAVTEPGTGVPTGTVTFYDGATVLGSAALAVTGGTNQAMLTVNNLPAASHTISAIYSGDTDFVGSTSPSIKQQVNKDKTSIAVISSANPAQVGHSITFTATISVASPGTGAPTGNVTFMDGSTVLATAPLAVVAGQAQATFSTTLSAGSHSITASYATSAKYLGSTSDPLVQSVTSATTTTKTTLTANPQSSVFGQAVKLTAQVTANTGTPTGSVSFYRSGQLLGTATLTGGKASLSVTSLPAGKDSITAVFAGGGSFAGSTSAAVVQQVNKATTALTLSSNDTTAVVGQTVTFTATLSIHAPGAGTPTGIVTFSDGSKVLGTSPVALVGGKLQATLQLSSLAIGSHKIKASYAGDVDFKSSTSAIVVEHVKQATTKTTLSVSATHIVAGQSVTFTATVAPVAPGGGTPSGTVVFKDGSTTLGTVTLKNSAGLATATLSTTKLSQGTHTITAVYNGTAGYAQSTSTALAETVLAAGATSTTSLMVSPLTSTAGQTVTLTATVTAGTGTPAGSVQFFDGTTLIGAGTISHGVASMTTQSLSVGTHSLVAQYVGSTKLAGSTSAAKTETVHAVAMSSALAAAPQASSAGQSIQPAAELVVTSPDAGTKTTLAASQVMPNFVASTSIPMIASATPATSTIPLAASTIGTKATRSAVAQMADAVFAVYDESE